MRALAAVLLLAAALRFMQLGDRPMHADEAILADRFGTLLETGAFGYDPSDYHGPVLAYASLPAAWLSRAARYADLTEPVIRAVPAIFGLALVALSYLIGKAGGALTGLFAAAFVALSPGLVYFSRYYIPEMALVCFSGGLIYSAVRYAEKATITWAIFGGACAGLAYATKETAVLALAAFVAGLYFLRPKMAARFGLAAGVTAILTALIAYGPTGLWESLRSLATYAARATDPPLHAHPWHFYLAVLFKSFDGLFLLLALAAIPSILARKRLALFALSYAAALTLLYSALPYKTPWCALGFLYGWILLAAIGVADISRRASLWPGRLVVSALFAGLLILSVRSSFPLAADPANPYVYAHTLPDVYLLRDRIASLARNHSTGNLIPMQVFTAENLWPLPWYLRSYPNVRWWRSVPASAPGAPMILLSPAMEEAVARHLYEAPPPGERQLYINLFDETLWLRPGVEVRGYAAASLVDR